MLSTRIHYVLKMSLPWLIAAVAAIAGGVLTYNAWQKSKILHVQNIDSQFQEAADIVAKSIQNRYETYTVIMRGVQGFFEASDNVSRAEFKQYIEALRIKEKLPGVQGIGLAVAVQEADLSAHINQARAQGVTNYHIHPEGKRSLYVPILHMQPEADENENVIGLDAFTYPIARTAMINAVKSNEVTITSRLNLYQDRDKPNSYGFVMYLPIFKSASRLQKSTTAFADDDEAFLLSELANIKGWVDVPFRMNELIGGLTGEFDKGITLKIYDGTTPSADKLLFDSTIDLNQSNQQKTTPEEAAIDPSLLTTRVIPIGGRDWLISVSGLKSFHAVGMTKSQPRLLAVTGITLTALLTLLSFLLARRFRAVEGQLSELFNKASDGILILNSAHRFSHANAAALNKLGYPLSSLIGLSFDAILSQQNKYPADTTQLLANAVNETPLELTLLTQSGTTFIAEVHINKLSRQQYFVTFNDLSDRIKAEQRITRLSKLYQALSETNQAILRMHDEDALFPLVVKSAVDYGGMKLAWIGRAAADVPNKDMRFLDSTLPDPVIPVAAYGEGLSALDEIRISTNPNVPQGLGPTGTALRTNSCVIINDGLNATKTAFWHNFAKKYGWASSASFPIQRAGKVYATLTLYSDYAFAFDDEAVSLFKEMAADISFAIDNFDREHQRKSFEEHLIANEAKLQLNAQVFEASVEGIVITDHHFNIQSANSSYLAMHATRSEAIIGRSLQETLFANQSAEFYHAIATVLHNTSRWQGEVSGLKADGTGYTQWISMSAIKDSVHRIAISHYVAIVHDISQYKEAQAKISYLSYFNSLTGLPNRDLLKERTTAAMATCQKNRSTLVLVLIDLDRFKIINDSLGIAVGDLVLQKVAKRLTEMLNLEYTACHQGSDEFMVLMPDTSAEEAALLCKKLLALIAQPFIVEQNSLTVTACLGLAVYPQDGLNFEALMQSAEAAMYRAKLRGRNNLQFFCDEMYQETSMTLQIENDLRDALTKEQFILHYQPQVDAISNEIIGFEALVRWQHPERGMVPPIQFIPIAEETDLIIDIGNWVLNEALRQQKVWQQSGLKVVPIAVNLSVIQFRQPGFYQTVENAIKQHGVAAHLLELELTESIAMEDLDFTIEVLSKFHALGVKLSIDDFGTGYSSLNYLKRFQIDKLKIDQSFVRDLKINTENSQRSQHDNQDAAIIAAIIQIAKALGFKTIAEGVETSAQLAFLQTNDCDEIQGYLFSKPIGAEACTSLLQTGSLLLH